MPTTFTLQTWNLWYGGREVDYGQEKQYAIAAQFPADVLAVQECWGTAAENLAPKLGAGLAQSGWDTAVIAPGELTPLATDTLRSEERRGGKEGKTEGVLCDEEKELEVRK